jgi:hypothetical protein
MWEKYRKGCYEISTDAVTEAVAKSATLFLAPVWQLWQKLLL